MSVWQSVKRGSSGGFPAWLVLASLVGVLAGCVTTNSYYYNNKTYPNQESLLQVQKANLDAGVNSIKPSPVVLSEKTLVVVFPSRELFVTLGRRNFKYLRAGIYTEQELEKQETYLLSFYAARNSYVEAVTRAKIFKSVQRVTQNSLEDPVPQATKETAVLWFAQSKPEGIGSAQWFYIDDKAGKQVLPYDNTSSVVGTVHANFVDAVKLMAIGQ